MDERLLYCFGLCFVLTFTFPAWSLDLPKATTIERNEGPSCSRFEVLYYILYYVQYLLVLRTVHYIHTYTEFCSLNKNVERNVYSS
jgi:hypothetical protein